jgi:hypothetical protein
VAERSELLDEAFGAHDEIGVLIAPAAVSTQLARAREAIAEGP